MEDLLIFPFGGNARDALPVVAALNRQGPRWRVLGFLDDDAQLRGAECWGHAVLGDRGLLREHGEAKVLAVPGNPDNYLRRGEIIAGLGVPPERFATLVHPGADIPPESEIGPNTLIMAGVVATTNVRIGAHCVVLPNTVLAHDVVIGEHCLIGSNVSFSGGVVVEPNAYIGTGTKIINGVRVGQGALIGLGACVIRDVEPYSVIVGNPGRLLRRQQP